MVYKPLDYESVIGIECPPPQVTAVVYKDENYVMSKLYDFKKERWDKYSVGVSGVDEQTVVNETRDKIVDLGAGKLYIKKADYGGVSVNLQSTVSIEVESGTTGFSHSNPASDEHGAINIGIPSLYTPKSITNADSPYTSSAGELIAVDASGGATTVNLPGTPNNKAIVVVSKRDGSTNAVTVDGNGNNINGGVSRDITAQYENLTFYYHSGEGEWIVI